MMRDLMPVPVLVPVPVPPVWCFAAFGRQLDGCRTSSLRGERRLVPGRPPYAAPTAST